MDRRGHPRIIHAGLVFCLVLAAGKASAANVAAKGPTAQAWSSHFGANPQASAGFSALKLELDNAKIREAFAAVMGRTSIEPHKLAEKGSQQPAIVQQAVARYGKELLDRLRQFASGASQEEAPSLVEELRSLRRVSSLMPEKQRPPIENLAQKIDLQFAINPTQVPANLDAALARVLRTSGIGPPLAQAAAEVVPAPAATRASIGEPDHARAQPVISKDQKTPARLRLAPFEGLRTTVLYSQEGLLRPNSGPVFALFGGTGGKARELGIGRSMTDMGHKIVDLGGSPLGFQNPIYHQDDRSDEERRPTIERYGSLDAQAEWMSQALEYVVSLVPQGADGRPLRPILLGTRSTGTAIFLQLTHDLIAGKPRARVLEKLTAALVMGVLGHSEAERKKWDALEIAYLGGQEGLIDPPVQKKGAVIYEAMDWAPEGERAPLRNDSVKAVPKLVATIGANDDQATARDQIEPLERFAAAHPQVDLTLLGLDTRHNPAAEVQYADRQGRSVKVATMRRLGPILESLLLHPMSYSPGLRFHAHPAFWDVPSVDVEILRRRQ